MGNQYSCVLPVAHSCYVSCKYKSKVDGFLIFARCEHVRILFQPYSVDIIHRSSFHHYWITHNLIFYNICPQTQPLLKLVMNISKCSATNICWLRHHLIRICILWSYENVIPLILCLWTSAITIFTKIYLKLESLIKITQCKFLCAISQLSCLLFTILS